MNTPRSKPPKRYEVPAISGSHPDGTYTVGLWSDRHCLLVGQIVTYWTTVEDRMIEILRDLSGGDQKLPARQIFRSIISNQAREKLLITLLERAEINREKEPFYDDVIRAFHNLNKRRNKYVHGFWQTYEDGETVYLSAESVDDFHFLTARRVPIKELEKTIHDMDTLGQKLLNHFVSVLKSKSSPKKLPRRRGKAKT